LLISHTNAKPISAAGVLDAEHKSVNTDSTVKALSTIPRASHGFDGFITLIG
jgi:hypothetical protein